MKKIVQSCVAFLMISITLSGQTTAIKNSPAVPSPPAFSNHSPLVGLCGSYNVGVGQTYTTLTAAINDLNLNGVSCPVTFVLNDNTYPSETFPITIGTVTGTSFTNTVTIKPGTGKTPTITGSSTTAILILNGSKYITINGSNSGGSDKSLTWANTNTTTNTYTIELMNGSGIPASNIIIKNCLIRASSQLTKNTYGIFLDNTNGAYDSIIINNNTIYSARIGIQFQGVAGSLATNGQITSNIIGSTTDAQAIQFRGIFLRQADNTLIQGNEIMGAPLGNANTAQAGIWIPGGALNTKIRQNKIHDWYYTGTGGFGNYGIYYGAGAASPTEISNNVITTIKADGDNANQDWMTAGIYINSGGTLRIYHNSIWLTGATLQPTYNGWSACLSIFSGITNLNVRDNIFKNSQTLASGTTGNTYAVYCASANSAFGNINYNDYYDDGVNPNIGYLGTNQATLAAWQSATGQDANSLNIDPAFTGINDLHTTVAGLAKAGIYIALVPVDITDAGRTNPPDIGAYQFSLNPAVTTTAASLITGTSATLNGTINANNATVATQFEYGLTIAYGTSVNGVPPTVAGSTLTNINAPITGLTASTLYHFRAKGTSGNVIVYGSDQTFTTTGAIPTAITNAATSVTCSNANLNGTINANGYSTAVTFEYGTTIAYGNTIPGVPGTVSGLSNTAVTAYITGLLSFTTYHFRVNGTNSNGTAYGNDMTFTTGATLPTVATNAATLVTATSAQLNGTVNPNCATTTDLFEYGLTASYGSALPGIPSPISGSITTAVTATLTGLLVNTTFHYRLCATNSFGTSCGNDMTFTTGCPVAGPAGPITGPASVCQGSSGYVYNVAPISNATGYAWSVPTGATITNGSNTNTITVSYSAVAVSGNISVYGTSLCGNGSPSQLAVTVNPLPVPAITGPAPACTNIPGLIYSTQTGMTGYIWNISAGGTITSGAGTNAITVMWNTAGVQSVTVTYTNSNGCAAAVPTVYPVTVNATTVPVITGSNNLCVNSGYYNYATQTGMSNYLWTVSPGGNITFGQGSNTVQIVWNVPGAQSVSVTFTNVSGCTPVSPTVFLVTVNPLPDGAGTITGTSSLCAGATGIAYSIAPVNNAVTYVWTLPAGATIATGAGTNAITVDYSNNASSGSITVYGNNLCGNGNASPPFPVTINPLPVPAGIISGMDSICQGALGVIYSVNPILNATGYIWTIPPGATIAGGTNTNSITVDFSPAANSGIFTVYGVNSCGNGTISPDFHVTVNPIPPTPVIMLSNDTLISNAPAGNQWYFNSIPIPGATGQTYVISEMGFYWDVVTINNCSSDTSNNIVVFDGIRDNEPGLRIDLYPNPNNGLFTLELSATRELSFDILVINNLGVTIRSQKDLIVKNGVRQIIDLRSEPNGVYTILIKNSDHSIIRKVVISR